MCHASSCVHIRQTRPVVPPGIPKREKTITGDFGTGISNTAKSL